MDDESLKVIPNGKENQNEYTRPHEKTTKLNEYPVIGVLAQETAYLLELIYPGQYKSFIAASYVKFVEGGGARVVPIWIDRPRKYYKDIMEKING